MFHRTRTTSRSLRPVALGFGTVTAIAAAVFFAPLAANAAAGAEPGDDDFLGTAEDYAIISADTIVDTDTHGTVVIGDVALVPGTDQQLLVVQVSGDINVNNTAADTADLDLNTGYVLLANAGATDVVGTVNLAARVTPYGAGVYFSGSDLLLDGTIVLSGSADDVFIFQASTGSLTVGTGSAVQLTGGVQACNVYWQVGSSATLGVDSSFVGTIVAATSISALQGAQITGQLLAGATNAGAVTLDDNYINAGSACVRLTSTERVLAEEQAAEEEQNSGEEQSGEEQAAEQERLVLAAAQGPTVLAETGVETMPLTITALALLLAGVTAFVLSRRTRAVRDEV